MPCYFFDVQVEGSFNRDKGGVELPDVSHVSEIAVPMMDEIATAKLSMELPRDTTVIVRDASDAVVYRAVL